MNHDYPEDMFTELECVSIVSGLKASRINFLAVDFDLTLVDMHTGGHFEGSPMELCRAVRPFFRSLIPMAISRDIAVGIVTFSPQTGLIQEVIHECFPECNIPVCGNDGALKNISKTRGKQEHIAAVAQELHDRGIEIHRCSTLLIDDDRDNIKIALNNKVLAQRCYPTDVRLMIDDLLMHFGGVF